MAGIAARQYGVVSRAQLLQAGLSGAAIARRVADRRLLRLHRGVYAVGHRVLQSDGHRLAAVLACGPGAVLSHRSAAEAWGLLEGGGARVEVTATDGGRRQAAIHAHRCHLTPADVTVHDGIPTTTVARTLLDLADAGSRRQLERALERSLQLRLFDATALTDTLARANGRRGTARLRAAVARLDPQTEFSHSDLEREALALVRDHGLPRPLVNADLDGKEVDLLWRDERVVVELDGYEFHATREAFERDRRRDADIQALGYRVQRLTWRQVTGEPDWVAARLAALLGAPA